VAIAEHARIGEQQDRERQAETRHATEIAALEKQQSAGAVELKEQSTNVTRLRTQLTEAAEKLAELKRQDAPRDLNEKQKADLVNALSPFRGQKVSVTATLGSDDALAYASYFIPVFKDAKWNVVTGDEPAQSVFTANPVGIVVMINKDDTTSPAVIARPLEALLATLDHLGLAGHGKNVFLNQQVEKGTIGFVIGFRPGPATP